MAQNGNNHRVAYFIRWTLIILAAILIVLFVFFAVQYRALRQQQILTARATRWTLILDHHAPLAPSEANVIRSWMTFDYINKLFALPPSYLQTQLNVTSTHYPRLTISSYEKTENLSTSASTTVFLNEVENAVRNYATSSTANATSGSI